MTARETLAEELRRHALVLGEVTLTSGATAAVLRRREARDPAPRRLRRAGRAASRPARGEWECTAVGGLTMGADAPACAALAGGAEVKAFFVRKEVKAHGLQRRIEGPPLEPGERCLIVEDVVTSGGSTVQAIEAVRAAGPRGGRRAWPCSTGSRAVPTPSARPRRGALRGARHDRRHPPGSAGRVSVTRGLPGNTRVTVITRHRLG